MKSGDILGRLEAFGLIFPYENATFEATLFINEVMEIDLNSHIYLEVINEVDISTFDIKLKLKEEDIDLGIVTIKNAQCEILLQIFRSQKTCQIEFV